MLLSLRSGIDSEIGWALDRLCRLCDNEQFLLRAIPGLTDALFEWPERYASDKDDETENLPPLFAPVRVHDRQRRHALESLFILRNAAVNEPNALELASHPRTQPMIFNVLQNRRADLDSNVEFILHAMELLYAVAPKVILPPASLPESSPIIPLQEMAGTSSNRALIIAALTALTAILSSSVNAAHLSSNSPALSASIRYLPLFADKPLVEACLNYLYVHLSHPAMAKAFLLRPDMPATLKLLVSLLLHEQVEETVSIDVGGDVLTVPAELDATRYHELTQEELDDLLEKSEPQRCYDWYPVLLIYSRCEGF
jgi:chromatin structure-remodeling complex subunit RSC9